MHFNYNFALDVAGKIKYVKFSTLCKVITPTDLGDQYGISLLPTKNCTEVP